MAKVHVLESDGQFYRVVFHMPVGSGSNRMDIAWTTALLNSGLGGMTTLGVGDGPGQIRVAEQAEILAGTTWEIVHRMPIDSTVEGGVRGYLDAEYAKVTTEQAADMKMRLRYFGGTRG